MSDAALKPDSQEIVVDQVFSHAPETIWKALQQRTDGALDTDAVDRVRARERQALHPPDNASWRVGRYHSLPGVGGHTERASRVCVEGRARK